MKNIISINCPSCGGSLKLNEGEKNAICEYCGSEFILSSKIGIERYFAKPIDNLKEYFRERNIKILESKILFVPLIKVKTEIFGWIYAHRKGKKITYQEKDERGRLKTYTVTIDETWIKKPVNVYRNDIFPIVKRMNLGLERLDLENIELIPYDDEMMHKIGFVMDLSLGIEKIKKETLKSVMKRFLSQFNEYDDLKYDIEPVLPHFSLIYYPLFIATTSIGYFVVDGIRKKPLYKEDMSKKNKKIMIKKYYIPIFTLITSICSFLNTFFRFIVFFAHFDFFILFLWRLN